jgi:hypothetical protein
MYWWTKRQRTVQVCSRYLPVQFVTHTVEWFVSYRLQIKSRRDIYGMKTPFPFNNTTLTTLAYHAKTYYHKHQRLRWSSSSVLASITQVRGFKPGRRRRIFQGEKFPSTPSFGGEVKPAVPRSRSEACKRSLNVTWKSAFRQNSRLFFLAL